MRTLPKNYQGRTRISVFYAIYASRHQLFCAISIDHLGNSDDIRGMGERLAICYATDDWYAYFALVSIDSMLRRTQNESLIDLFVLDCGLSDESKRQMEQRIRMYPGANLVFFTVEPSRLDPFLTGGCLFPPSTFARVLIPQFIDRECVLYVDCDTVFLSDVTELWREAMASNMPIAAARDFLANFHNVFLHADVKKTASNFRILERLGIPDEAPYFNAGLLFLRRRELLRLSFTEKIAQLVREEPGLSQLGDQNFINCVMKGMIAPLSYSWNFQVPMENVRTGVWRYEGSINRSLYEPKMVHFTSPEKPWISDYSAPEARFFHEAAERVPAWPRWRSSGDGFVLIDSCANNGTFGG